LFANSAQHLYGVLCVRSAPQQVRGVVGAVHRIVVEESGLAHTDHPAGRVPAQGWSLPTGSAPFLPERIPLLGPGPKRSERDDDTTQPGLQADSSTEIGALSCGNGRPRSRPEHNSGYIEEASAPNGADQLTRRLASTPSRSPHSSRHERMFARRRVSFGLGMDARRRSCVSAAWPCLRWVSGRWVIPARGRLLRSRRGRCKPVAPVFLGKRGDHGPVRPPPAG
jgi:hypothetical protein